MIENTCSLYKFTFVHRPCDALWRTTATAFNLYFLMFSGSIVDYDCHPIENGAVKVYGILQQSDVDEAYRNNVKMAVSVLEECLEKYR